MSTLMDILASRKKPAATPAPEETLTVLPVLSKEHEGECGEGCGCGGEEGGCCGS